jgi:hypothetical protein
MQIYKYSALKEKKEKSCNDAQHTSKNQNKIK